MARSSTALRPTPREFLGSGYYSFTFSPVFGFFWHLVVVASRPSVTVPGWPSVRHAPRLSHLFVSSAAYAHLRADARGEVGRDNR